ncbi:MAG: hypothetical protein BMS9Abin07_2223 [Acidimicrobiia bacterium]|nr:MAG: hypothetical protein BMS9Abin07_2223 [Acidimicrobiia bacterium]
MTRRITLIRHAETAANVRGGWQGHSDSELSDRGQTQIVRLAARFTPDAPPLLISSDLGRAMATADALGSAEPDRRWREYDFGEWEGLRSAEIEQRFPGGLAALRTGDDFRPEGGESQSEFAARIQEALAAVVSRLDDGEQAVVVAHGGLIHSLIALILGADPAGLALPANTSATTVVLDDGQRPQVFTYNDASHLDGDVARAEGRRVMLYRHGEAVANVEHRWHGHRESPLTERGRRQASDLAATASPLDVIVSSPLSRAHQTAVPVAQAQGRQVAVDDALKEMHFGEWEGMTSAEVEAAYPDLFERVFRAGIDEPRGRTGETFAEAGRRLAAAIDEVIAETDAGSIGLFTHGGVTRAYVAGVLGVSFAQRDALPVLRNTAHGEVVIGARRTRLVSYNVAPHLER